MKYSNVLALFCSTTVAAGLLAHLNTTGQPRCEGCHSDVSIESQKRTAQGRIPDNVADNATGNDTINDMAERATPSKDTERQLEDLEKTWFTARYHCPKTYRGNIYFYNVKEEGHEDFLYHLWTPWIVFYSSRLRKKLDQFEFRVLDNKQIDRNQCDVWDPLFSVKKGGVLRGNLELNWPEDGGLAVLSQDLSWVVTDWNLVEGILKREAPKAEFIVIGFGSFVALFILCGFGWSWRARWLKNWITGKATWQDYRERRTRTDGRRVRSGSDISP